MSGLDKRLSMLEAPESQQRRSAAEMSDAELLAIVIRPHFGRTPSAAQVSDALKRFNALTDAQIAAAHGRDLAEVLYAA